MRTTLDLPDDMLRRAKIAAVERGYTLRQIVIDALQQELDAPRASSRRRLPGALLTLAADAPLRTLRPDEVKQLDSESMTEADTVRAHALHR